MNDTPTDPSDHLATEAARIHGLLTSSQEERDRLEKVMDLLTLKAEELTAKRGSLDEVGTRIGDLESRLSKTEKRSESFEKIDV